MLINDTASKVWLVYSDVEYWHEQTMWLGSQNRLELMLSMVAPSHSIHQPIHSLI